MIDRDIDTTVIGRNYLSYLYGMGLLRKGRKVFLLEDERMQMGDLFCHVISSVEKCYLSEWAKHSDGGPLVDLDQYIVPKSYIFCIDGVHLSLGGARPSLNLLELIRKFPELFSFDKGKGPLQEIDSSEFKDQFDQAYFEYCKRLGQSLFKYKNLRNLNLESFTTLAPAGLKQLFEQFSKFIEGHLQYDEKVRRRLRAFLYATRGYYHNKFTIKGSDFEFFHLMLSLLSPGFLIDHVQMWQEMVAFFQSAGGQYHQGRLKSWKFYGKRPWAIELESALGLVTPGKIVFMGGRPRHMPVDVETKLRVYDGLNVIWTVESDLFQSLAGLRLNFAGLEKMGTSRPMWIGDFEDSSVQFKVFVRGSKGSKLSFYKEDIRNMIREDLRLFAINIDGENIKERIFYGDDVWVEEERDQIDIYHNRMAQISEVGLIDCSAPQRMRGLKDVDYFGPIKEGPLGLLSTLMEIRDGLAFVVA